LSVAYVKSELLSFFVFLSYELVRDRQTDGHIRCSLQIDYGVRFTLLLPPVLLRKTSTAV